MKKYEGGDLSEYLFDVCKLKTGSGKPEINIMSTTTKPNTSNNIEISYLVGNNNINIHNIRDEVTEDRMGLFKPGDEFFSKHYLHPGKHMVHSKLPKKQGKTEKRDLLEIYNVD